jgi:AcrR family transcriptional regulator
VAGARPEDASGQGAGKGAAADERGRLISAVARSAAEHGYTAFDPEDAARRAGLPSEAFEAHFASSEQALLAAGEAFLERLWDEACAACEAEPQWPGKVHAALEAVLSYLSGASAAARAFLVEAPAASLAAAERQFAAAERFAVALARGREHYPQVQLPALTERVLAGGIASLLRERLLAEETQALAALGPALAEMLLAPYSAGQDP